MATKVRNSLFKMVTLHPATIKHLKKGHPWVTADTFTAKFPKEQNFLVGTDQDKNKVALIMNDSEHGQVKARLWSMKQPFDEEVMAFVDVFGRRLERSIKKRLQLNIQDERENFYLVFGEADFLPGLKITKIGRNILVQYYAMVWNKLEKKIINIMRKKIEEAFPENKLYFWKQNRTGEKNNNLQNLDRGKREFEVKEFGCSYKINFSQGYDIGIYTDMSSIRKKLIPLMAKSESFLNLYAYTGAYTVCALKHGAKKATSVDLSEKYLNWLHENLELNDLGNASHDSYCSSVEKALQNFKQDKKSFDLIVCDPPSASSDGKKMSKALNNYEKLILSMEKVLSSDGKMVIFLNTHNISKKKFTDTITKILTKTSNLQIESELKLKDDCPTLAQFPEGSYLKGLLISRKAPL